MKNADDGLYKLHKNAEKYMAGGTRKADLYYRTLEWLITAFAGTLVFITFEMQVYRIPTGSMAETLRGAHFRLRCSQCGYRYDFDWRPDAYRLPANYVPKQDVPVRPGPPRCPSCGYYEPTGVPSSDGRIYVPKADRLIPMLQRAVCKGDQIFVLKCIYQFFEPGRWDVVVFKYPCEPKTNYIKRLIGLPGETVEIIDGDIYINGLIERKNRRVQQELWTCVYDNDYQPAVMPDAERFNRRQWRQPFENEDGSAWNLAADGPSVFELKTGDGREHSLRYNSLSGNDFRAVYAYDDPASYPQAPLCSDLQVRFFPQTDGNEDSAAGAAVQKYGIEYQGWVHNDGTMEIFRITNEKKELLADGKTARQIGQFRFAAVDHIVALEYGRSRIQYDLGRRAEDAGSQRQKEPQVRILAKGSVKLRHIGIDRDIHYISRSPNVKRAYEGSGFTLGRDEFFVCGDNSPFSADCRIWTEPGVGNNGKTYPAGLVPRDYLVGKAFFVHLPGLWPFQSEKARLMPYLDGVPCPDDVKVIFGGGG